MMATTSPGFGLPRKRAQTRRTQTQRTQTRRMQTRRMQTRVDWRTVALRILDIMMGLAWAAMIPGFMWLGAVTGF